MEQKITIPEGYELQKVNDSEYRIVKKEKEKEFPNSWEEFCEDYPAKAGESCVSTTSDILILHNYFERCRNEDTDKNLLPNKEYAEAILALCQLIQLRDCYRQGWKPDWGKGEINKYCIEFNNNKIRFTNHTFEHKIFSFQSKEIRDKFYDNFKDLIEKIKPLFM